MVATDANTTRNQLLAQAQQLICTRGCNGFSYRDLADLVGVKSATIHYYFPSKDDLLFEAIQAYNEQVMAKIRVHDAREPARQRLEAYLAGVSNLCGTNKLCLGGMLAAELMSYSDKVRSAVQAFFHAQEKWLVEVLAQGAAEGTLRFHGTPEEAARAVCATVQGRLLIGRLTREPLKLRETLNALFVDAIDPAEPALH